MEVRLHMTLASLLARADFPGLTAPMPHRLQHLCEATVELEADPDQLLRLVVQAGGQCPAPLHEPMLRIAHELVGNAVRHGMYARSVGRITVRLMAPVQGLTRLYVADDGWGFKCPLEHGGGLSRVAATARRHGGGLTLERVAGLTTAVASLRG